MTTKFNPKEWYERNKKRLSELDKKRYERNKAERQNNARIYYHNNKEKMKAYTSKYQKENKGNYDKWYKNSKKKDLDIIRNKTRKVFPLKDMLCFHCENKATGHHHTTNPIVFDKFEFVCNKCHFDIHHKLKLKRLEDLK